MNIENPGSYIVQLGGKDQEVKITKTSFAPGYTPAHKATAKEALDHMISNQKALVELLQKQIEMLLAYREQADTVMSDN